MALNLSSVTDHGIGCIVLSLSCFFFFFVFCFFYKINGKQVTRNKGNFDILTARWRRFLAGKVCSEKAQSHLSRSQQRS